MKDVSIPNFQLYGTAETVPPNLFFNIARTPVIGQRANYHQAPHRRAPLYQLVWLSAGATEITIDEITYSLGRDTL